MTSRAVVARVTGRFPPAGGNVVIFNRATDYTTVFLRVAVGISFLSAVADRFGLWGAYGQANVAWGDCSRLRLRR
jgi:hypothetical protein